MILHFAGGPVDASTFQPLKGPTSRSVPWTDPLVDVVFPALATASRLAVLVERHEHYTQNAIPAAQDEHDWSAVGIYENQVSELDAELRELHGYDLLWLRWLERQVIWRDSASTLRVAE